MTDSNTSSNRSQLWDAGALLLRLAFNHDAAKAQGLGVSNFEDLIENLTKPLSAVAIDQQFASKVADVKEIFPILSELHYKRDKSIISADEFNDVLKSAFPKLTADQLNILTIKMGGTNGVADNLAKFYGVNARTIPRWIEQSTTSHSHFQSLHIDELWDAEIESLFLTKVISEFTNVSASNASSSAAWLIEKSEKN